MQVTEEILVNRSGQIGEVYKSDPSRHFLLQKQNKNVLRHSYFYYQSTTRFYIGQETFCLKIHFRGRSRSWKDMIFFNKHFVTHILGTVLLNISLLSSNVYQEFFPWS
jgi:hypothetical protein